MDTPKVTIHNSETGEIIERDMNAEELKQYKVDITRDAARAAELEEKATAKAALLDRLRITADEAKLLLA